MQQVRVGGRAWGWALSESLRKGTKWGSFRELTGSREGGECGYKRGGRRNILFPELSFAGLDGALGVDSTPVVFNALALRVQIKHPTLSTRAGEGTGLTLEWQRQETGMEGN